MVVRLVLSHVMQPTGEPAETAETIAWIVDRATRVLADAEPRDALLDSAHGHHRDPPAPAGRRRHLRAGERLPDQARAVVLGRGVVGQHQAGLHLQRPGHAGPARRARAPRPARRHPRGGGLRAQRRRARGVPAALRGGAHRGPARRPLAFQTAISMLPLVERDGRGALLDSGWRTSTPRSRGTPRAGRPSTSRRTCWRWWTTGSGSAGRARVAARGCSFRIEDGELDFLGEPMDWTPAADDPGHQMTDGPRALPGPAAALSHTVAARRKPDEFVGGRLVYCPERA